MTIQNKIQDFEQFFLTLPITRNGGSCTEIDNKEIGVSTLPNCYGQEFGDDDNFASNAYFTNRIEIETFNRIVKHKAIITIKVWETMTKNGYEKPEFVFLSNIVNLINQKYKNNKAQIVCVDNRAMRLDMTVEIDNYQSCTVAITPKPELC